jgi:hypothetical protein
VVHILAKLFIFPGKKRIKLLSFKKTLPKKNISKLNFALIVNLEVNEAHLGVKRGNRTRGTHSCKTIHFSGKKENKTSFFLKTPCHSGVNSSSGRAVIIFYKKKFNFFSF